ncbi:hypothetical protein [Bacillus bombysepticus]|uniref:hypothetical protein n=1 Tax=Bacillus bombysepticus TaxID=658666 RepID=UPI003018948E
MDEVTYEEFVKKELERWVQLNSEGKDLPGIVNRVLETAYKNLTRIPEETPSLREGIMRERI